MDPKKRRQAAWPSHTQKKKKKITHFRVHRFMLQKKIVLYSNKGTINYNQQCHPLHLGNKQYKQFPKKKYLKKEKGRRKEKKKKKCEREGKGEGKGEEMREREEERVRMGRKRRRKK